MAMTKGVGIAAAAAITLFAASSYFSGRSPKPNSPSIASQASGPIRSARLRDLPPAPQTRNLRQPIRPFRGAARRGGPLQPVLAPYRPFADTFRQLGRAGTALSHIAFPSLAAMPLTLLNFDGVGNGFSGPQGTFTVNSAPPDTNGDVGPNHYVQTVNTDFAIFDKSGNVLYGPVPLNTLWSGFGGGCQNNNDGDPSVLYDPIADRWIISQFSVSTTPYLQCVAVSTSADPTGSYYRYSFSYGNTDFIDYGKLGVWPDAYYITFNIFANGASFSGAKVCAYDRLKMLTGQPATQQCFNTTSDWGGLLPSDLDGARLPPAGSPNYVVAFGTNDLGVWKFHVDWTTPSNSTFSGPTTIATDAFTDACNDGTCIPQSGTTQKLDSLGDRLMYRLAYRNHVGSVG